MIPVRDDIAYVEVSMDTGGGLLNLVKESQGALPVLRCHGIAAEIERMQHFPDGGDPVSVGSSGVQLQGGLGKGLDELRHLLRLLRQDAGKRTLPGDELVLCS